MKIQKKIGGGGGGVWSGGGVRSGGVRVGVNGEVKHHHHHHHHIRFRARFPLPRVGLFDKSSSKMSSPLRAILRVSRVHI